MTTATKTLQTETAGTGALLYEVDLYGLSTLQFRSQWPDLAWAVICIHRFSSGESLARAVTWHATREAAAEMVAGFAKGPLKATGLGPLSAFSYVYLPVELVDAGEAS